MNFEQATQALDTLTQALKNGEQRNIISDKELNELRADKEHYLGRLQELEGLVNKLQVERDTFHDRYVTEARNNGELKATLKQLLAEQMALASRAAEMLRSLEEKPKQILKEIPIHINETPAFNINQVPKEIAEKLAKFIARDDADLKQVPCGRTFTIYPPDPKDAEWRGVKWWYRLTVGKCPASYKELPGVEFLMTTGGKSFNRFVAPAEEGREPLPFRTEDNIIQTAFPPDDGQELPKFLTNGIRDDNRETGERA
jgi:hypothetical protein